MSPIKLIPKPSRIFALFSLIVYSSAFACIVYCGFSVVITVLLITALLMHVTYRLLTHNTEFHSLYFSSRTQCWLMQANNERVFVECVSCCMTRYLTVLTFSVPGKRFLMPVVFWPDSAPPDSLRQLRVRLFVG